MDYRPVWTGIGILAGYLAAGLSLTYYARQRLGARRWRTRTASSRSPGRWRRCTSSARARDAGSLWLQVPLALTMALVLTLMGRRVLDSVRGPRGPTARTRARRAADPADAGAGAHVRLRGPDPADGGRARPWSPPTNVPTTPGYTPLWAPHTRPARRAVIWARHGRRARELRAVPADGPTH